jgi:hypothetical protein
MATWQMAFLQRIKLYSRIIVLVGSAFGCFIIIFWLINTGHYRWPLIVLVAYLVGTPLILRKLAPITKDPNKIRKYQLRAFASVRRMGWIYVAGLVLGTLVLISEGTHGIPWWAVALIYVWSGFLIWSSFRTAKRLKKAADAGQPGNESKLEGLR